MISVITVLDTLSETITNLCHSLQAQTCQDFEWILVKDNTRHPAAEELQQQPGPMSQKIRIIDQPAPMTPAAARNTGVSLAKGEFVFFIDADGSITPPALEKMLLTFELNPNFDFVNSYAMDAGDHTYAWRGGFHEGKLFLQNNRSTQCFMSKKYVFEKISFDETLKDGYEIREYWLHAASLGFWGYTIPEFLFYHTRPANEGWLQVPQASPRETKKQTASILNRYRRLLHRGNFPVRHLSDYNFEPVIDSPLTIHSSLPAGEDAKTILFIFPWLEVGGADKFNLDLTGGLKDNNWSITIACTAQAKNEWLPEFEKITADIFLLPNYSTESNYYKAIEHLIISRRVRIVFLSHSMYGYYLLPFLQKRFPSLPVTDYIHVEEAEWYNGGYPMLSTMYDKSLAKTFVTSHYLKSWCRQKGKQEDKMEVAYINIDTAEVKRDNAARLSLRNKLGAGEDTCVILYVARLTPQKQPDVLLKAINKLYAANRNFLCVIIGDGPERDFLLRIIGKSAALKNIRYLGSLSNDQVKKYMDAADVFFLPSAYEGIALSIFEAMSKQLAIVGANVGGQQELVTGECGILVERSVPDKEAQAYSLALKGYVENSRLTQATGNASRERVLNSFDIRLMITQMDRSLNKVIGEFRSAEGATAAEYIILLNRTLMLTSENKDLANSLNKSLRGFIARRTRHLKLAQNIYHKFNLSKNKQ